MAHFKVTNEDIAKGLARHTKALRLLAEGKIEEARRVFWWPTNEPAPPKVHWSQLPYHPCSCGKHTAEGLYGFCGYCQGVTSKTPSLIRRR